MTDHGPPPIKPWINGLLAAARTFSAITGTAGFGLLTGLVYGAWLASRTASSGDPFGWIVWPICLVLYGAIGFVVGLVVALLVTLFVGILKVAKPIARAIEQPSSDVEKNKEREPEV